MDTHNSSPLDWDLDLQAFEILGFGDTSLHSGYLEDAIFQWIDPCKRRRLLVFDEDISENSSIFLQDSWKIDLPEETALNSSCSSQTSGINSITDDPLNSSMNSISVCAGLSRGSEMKTHDDFLYPTVSCRKTLHKYPDNLPFSNSASEDNQCVQKKKAGKRIAYPFAVVKPGGTEEDVTLGEINKSILMRPNRPIRHPVGEFACVPSVSSGRPGLSGKDVVTLTRIHTTGKGTITIIRTRG